MLVGVCCILHQNLMCFQISSIHSRYDAPPDGFCTCDMSGELQNHRLKDYKMVCITEEFLHPCKIPDKFPQEPPHHLPTSPPPHLARHINVRL